MDSNIKPEKLEDLLTFTDENFNSLNSPIIKTMLNMAFMLGQKDQIGKMADRISEKKEAVGKSVADGCNNYFDTLN